LEFYDIEPYVFNPIKDARFMELKLKSYKSNGRSNTIRNKIKEIKICKFYEGLAYFFGQNSLVVTT